VSPHFSDLVLRFINTTTFVASIFGSGEARRGSIPRSGAVTEEQRSQNRKAAQPFGRRFFLAQTSLLTPYRPLKGMRVARASSGPKIPRRKRGRIYEMEYLDGRTVLRESAYPSNWEASRDGSRCSLSRRTGYVFSVGFRDSGFPAVVARASRPCVGCTIRTGGTPVPQRWKRRGRLNVPGV